MLNKTFLYYLVLSGSICLFFSHCSPSYNKYCKQYTVNNQNQAPNYHDLYYWASHPLKNDPADSISLVFKDEKRDTVADVFFIYPTSYTGDTTDGLNADIHNAKLNAKTDYSSILYQATVFNQHARIFAPRYRQANLVCFSIHDTLRAKAAFDTAYEDVKNAFLYYLNKENRGRPFIIASHSQGTIHAGRLLKEFIENTERSKQLVAAYLLGMPVPEYYFKTLKPCQNASSTGCFVSWRTYRSGYIPNYIQKENFKAIVVNPLTWTTTSELAPKEKNQGAILYKFNIAYSHTNDARVSGNVLWAHRPKFPWSFLYRTRNYHVGDINLFYLNIRQNIETRLTEYFKGTNQSSYHQH